MVRQTTSVAGIKKYLYYTLFILSGFTCNAYSQSNNNDTSLLQFELFYETMQPMSLLDARLYISPEKLLGKSDSIDITINANGKFSDTLFAKYPWKFPVHAWIKLNFSNQAYTTNKFYLDPLNRTWQISISDTAAVIKTKLKSSFDDKKSLLGIILILQTILELILAVLFTRIFHWPGWAILVVLVANLATFPIYLLKIHPAILADVIMLTIKFSVIFLTGRRRLGIYRILLLVITLSLISFGFKEILILLSKLI